MILVKKNSHFSLMLLLLSAGAGLWIFSCRDAPVAPTNLTENIPPKTVLLAKTTVAAVEAESMTLTNYVVNTNSAASGGNLIKLSASGVTGTATYTFTGATGTYDIQVWYFDENDGACTFRIYVAGTQVDSWVADQNLGSTDPVAQTLTSRTKTGVTISNGAQIKLEAVQNSQEWGRYDKFEISTEGTPSSFAINCGGSAVSPFVADVDYIGGTAATNWTGAINVTGLTNPAPQAVYQSERWGPVTYTIPGYIAGSSNTVRLHFCENLYTGTGQRAFNVSINGTAVLTNYDIYAATGALHKAVIKEYVVNANGSGQYVIALSLGTADNPLINGIEVVSSGGGNQAPTVSITSPSDGASFTSGANITINANASDADGSVTKVDFYQGTTLLGTDTSSPYSFTWNNVPERNYALTAKATDDSSATTTSSVVNISVTTPPTSFSIEAESMTLTNYVVNTNSSASGGNLIKLSASGVTGSATYNFTGSSGSYDIKVWYYDENDGSCTFRIYVGGTMVDEWVANQSLGSADPVAQTRTSRTKTGVSIANGAQIKLEAVQNSQEWGRYDLVEFTLVGGTGNQPPTVSITSPANGATFTAPANITINANASDSDGSVTLVEFFQGSTKLGEDATSPYSYTWSNVAAGSYSLTAKATDNGGATTTSVTVNITVNQAPTVSITSPSDGASFTSGSNITINASASDADGSVTKVDFYQGSTLLGTDTSSPYSFAWNNVTQGNYALTAAATDNNNATTTSSAVNITVNAATAFPVDLQGTSLPEEKTVSIDVTKPGDATNATLTMVVFDPDQTNEGTLYVNVSNSLTLFGSQGVSGNDNQTKTLTYDTPVSWWVDGSNSLRFVHTSTGGYRVESASVSFSSAPPLGDFPVDLQGTSLPEEETVSIDVTKPSGATDATLTMVVFDPDQTNEGTLYVNGSNSITLFGSQGVSGNDQQTKTITYSTPESWWVDGSNLLRFVHTSTGGYRVESASVSFSSGSSWVLTFSDEFSGASGTAPDPSKWNLLSYQRRPGGAWSASDVYQDGNGHLVIRVRKIATDQYSSGCASTGDAVGPNGAKFAQTYGKWECSCQMPTQQGWWVAWWMMCGSQGSIGNGSVDGVEIDIMEGWGWTDKQNHNLIWDGYGSSSASTGQSTTQAGIRNGFHTYTLIWDPTYYAFQIDGVEFFRTTAAGICNQPGICQVSGEISTESWAISDTWAKDPADATYPDYFYVDWVRVYQAQ